MMLSLPDDLLLQTFDSPETPPNWIEWIDVENGEYAFSSDRGQRYEGRLERKAGLFRAEEWQLVPYGAVDIENAIALVNRAVGVDHKRCVFPDLISAKAHFASDALSAGSDPTNT